MSITASIVSLAVTAAVIVAQVNGSLGTTITAIATLVGVIFTGWIGMRNVKQIAEVKRTGEETKSVSQKTETIVNSQRTAMLLEIETLKKTLLALDKSMSDMRRAALRADGVAEGAGQAVADAHAKGVAEGGAAKAPDGT